MGNILKKATHSAFSWETMGDIEQGRGGLGVEMPVVVYRLMQYTLLDVLTAAYGLEKANEHFRRAGFLAGEQFAKHTLNLDEPDLNAFLKDLQEKLKEMKIGILRLESIDPQTGEMVLTVGEDLDCSGLPITNENVCMYDEGFISGILHAYTGVTHDVREVDCWASGDRVCRFRASRSES